MHSPPNSPPIQAATWHWAEFPVLYSRTLLGIHFKYKAKGNQCACLHRDRCGLSGAERLMWPCTAVSRGQCWKAWCLYSIQGPLNFALMQTTGAVKGVPAKNEDHWRGCRNNLGFSLSGEPPGSLSKIRYNREQAICMGQINPVSPNSGRKSVMGEARITERAQSGLCTCAHLLQSCPTLRPHKR